MPASLEKNLTHIPAAATRTIRTAADLAEGIAWLAKHDRRLKQVIATAGALRLRRWPGGFSGLLRIVVGQQLSVASANAIWARVEKALPQVSAEAIHRAGLGQLQKAGLSGPRIRTMRAVAEAVRAGLDLEALAHAPPAEAHAALTAIHGIGAWTADIYLMFCVGHADIFPAGDLALRSSVAHAFNLAKPVPPAAVAEIAKAWSPWRSVAATLFWTYYGTMKTRKTVPL